MRAGSRASETILLFLTCALYVPAPPGEKRIVPAFEPSPAPIDEPPAGL